MSGHNEFNSMKKTKDILMKEEISRDKIVFAGCSITEFSKWNELLNDMSIINRGITGEPMKK